MCAENLLPHEKRQPLADLPWDLFISIRWGWLHLIEFLIPLCKLPQSLPQGGGRLEAEITFQCAGIGIGHRDVAGLHGHQLLVGFKVVVGREYPGGDQFLLQDVHEILQVFGVLIANVIHRIRRDGQTILAVFLFRRALHHPNHALHDVIDVGKVPLAVAIVENLDGLALEELIRKAKVGHIRPPGGAIDREEPQTRGGNVVELTVGVGHQLVTLFCGSVEGHGVIHLVLGRVGHLLVGSVNAGRGRIHQMLHGVVAAGFQDVIEADEIALDVGIGVGDGVANASLGRQIHYNFRVKFGENVVNGIPVGDVTLNERPGGFRVLRGAGFNLCQPPVLDGHIVIVVQVVDTHNFHGRHGFQQLQNQIGANETGGAGDEDCLVL